MAVTEVRLPGIHQLQDTESDRIDFDFAKKIKYLDRARTPLAAFLGADAPRRKVGTDRFGLFRGELIPRVHNIDEATTLPGTTAGATAADVDLDGVTGLVDGMICLVHADAINTGNTAGVLVRITNVDTGANQVDMTNLSGGTISANMNLQPIGYAAADDEETGPGYVDMEPDTVFGHLTLIKRLVKYTSTEADSDIRGAPNREAEKIERGRMDFMRDREMNAWFSRSTTDVGDNKIRTSMGVHEQLASTSAVIKTDAGANALADADLGNSIADGAKYYANDEITIFHGARVLSGLFVLGAGKLQTKTMDSKYGFRAQAVQVAQYMLPFVHTQIFDVIGNPWDALAIGLDLGSVESVRMQRLAGKGGDPRLFRNVDPKASQYGEVTYHMWRSQEGVAITIPERHFIIYNLGKPA